METIGTFGMMKRFGWAGLSLCLAVSVAHATPVAPPGQQIDTPGIRAMPLRVQVNYQLVVPMNRDGSLDE